jgi:hypothetical protein
VVRVPGYRSGGAVSGWIVWCRVFGWGTNDEFDGRGQMEVPFQHFPGRPEENHRRTRAEYPASLARMWSGGRGLMETPFQHFPGRPEENHLRTLNTLWSVALLLLSPFCVGRLLCIEQKPLQGIQMWRSGVGLWTALVRKSSRSFIVSSSSALFAA